MLRVRHDGVLATALLASTFLIACELIEPEIERDWQRRPARR